MFKVCIVSSITFVLNRACCSVYAVNQFDILRCTHSSIDHELICKTSEPRVIDNQHIVMGRGYGIPGPASIRDNFTSSRQAMHDRRLEHLESVPSPKATNRNRVCPVRMAVRHGPGTTMIRGYLSASGPVVGGEIGEIEGDCAGKSDHKLSATSIRRSVK